ncbi:hypothetical protein H9L10_13545 [Phycicoccus endophyticus]|uniref:Lipoprotein n=1 Tax=Phycicoccus endophyticus TaxID=1690220 RepID=A0A7G9R0V7_9MICO|nr:hypothetical protein [Phycicoccus endophyticus]NHI19521.1 hypothetical protein [Phycicoccus endophyticus]QNN49232.1 hypothetical protein H9L10_13545 [Phycicoccus endophyticus]GGL39873.1 hypothetical protein GCM10012283_22920 [Phycicoccus endophyticus]
MTRRLAALTAAALATIALTGCSDDPDTPEPTGSGSVSVTSGDDSATASPTSSPSPSLEDRSAELLEGAAPLTEIARTRAAKGSSFAGSTFTFYQLTRSDASTLLVWRVSGGKGSSSPSDANVRRWENYPVMVADAKEYSVVTFDKEVDGWSALSNPILRITSGSAAPPQSALYPPLPAGTSSVTLTSPWFADVEVPVTEAATAAG